MVFLAGSRALTGILKCWRRALAPTGGRTLSTRCRYCGAEAVVRVPYAKLNLCAEHFGKFVVDRVKEAFRRYGMAGPGAKILLALSGGKDSSSLAYIMREISSSMGFKLAALHIDLGIGEFSKRSREAVENVCRKLGIQLVLIDLKRDLGFDLIDLIRRLRSKRVCSLCGVVKRYVMNAVAIELNADAVATAHHADDVLTYIFKNFVIQDYNYMRKLLPVNMGIPNTVATRIKPLYEIYERDLVLYAKHLNIDFVDMDCPFAKEEGMETVIRKFVEDLEARAPGTKISILRKFVKAHLGVQKDVEGYGRCSSCGLVSLRDRCSFCKLTEKCFGKPLGPAVREIIRQRFGDGVWA